MTFANARTIDANAYDVYSVFAADLDGDGDIDVVAGLYIYDQVSWYENLDGNGTFSEQLDVSPCCDYDGAT